MKVGVLAVQGAVVEHMESTEKAMDDISISGDVVRVRKKGVIPNLDALIIPGGESSTISRLIEKFELRDEILKGAENGMQIMGTCAGSILLASDGCEAVERSDTELLGLMDMNVERNAFGRQKKSFEKKVDLKSVADAFPGVFIRAPAITSCGAECSVLSTLGDTIIAAEEENMLALVFHPELTGDTRVHEYFLEKVG